MKYKRLMAAFIDNIICSIPFVVITFCIIFLKLDNQFLSNWLPLIAYYIIFLSKDLVYKNASIGKKILNIRIVNNDGKEPLKKQLIFRNIFIFLWPIEVILIMINNKKIEDYLFKTSIVSIA